MSDNNSENSEVTESRPLRFVAVLLGVSHVGEEQKSVEFAKKICEEIMLQTDKVQHLPACQNCMVSPEDKITAETAVIQLVKEMEDNPDLNCGLGSNLNMGGQVECDAGLMYSKTKTWNGLGAVSGCKNPILLAKSLHDHQDIPRPLGLAQPDLLLGPMAKEWMKEHCPQLSVPDSNLISLRALSQYQKYKSSYDNALKEEAEDGGPRKKQRQGDEGVVNLGAVGAIAIDHDYNFAAAVSSGGTLLKHKGSIGHAAVPGGGCWARDMIGIAAIDPGKNSTQSSIAKTIAENICETRLEFELMEDVEEDDDIHMLDCKFNYCVYVPLNEAGKNPVGVLAVNTFWGEGSLPEDESRKLYFHYGHNTETMCIGYMTSEDSTGHSIISRQKSEKAGKGIVNTIVFPID